MFQRQFQCDMTEILPNATKSNGRHRISTFLNTSTKRRTTKYLITRQLLHRLTLSYFKSLTRQHSHRYSFTGNYTYDEVHYVLLVETNLFPEIVVIFLDFAIPTSLGTFSILPIVLRFAHILNFYMTRRVFVNL